MLEYLHRPHANHHIPQPSGVLTGDPKTPGTFFKDPE